MKWYIIVLICLLIIILFIQLMVSFRVVRDLTLPKRLSRKEQDEYSRSKGYYDGLSIPKREEITFTMKDGYVIHGDYSIINDSINFVILTHGHTSTREASVRYALVFQELGFNTIIYDVRSHGDNVRNDVTMGTKESLDLDEIIKQVYEKFGSNIKLGIHGVSMGAATTLLALKYNQNVKFAISDCGYAKISYVVKDSLNKEHLPGVLFLPCVNLLLKIFHGFTYKNCAPILSISKNNVPILFIHGSKDDFVKPYHMEMLYEKATSYKQKQYIEAGHARSVIENRSLYKETIQNFLNHLEDDTFKKVY